MNVLCGGDSTYRVTSGQDLPKPWRAWITEMKASARVCISNAVLLTTPSPSPHLLRPTYPHPLLPRIHSPRFLSRRDTGLETGSLALGGGIAVPGKSAWDGRFAKIGWLRGGVNGPVPRGYGFDPPVG